MLTAELMDRSILFVMNTVDVLFISFDSEEIAQAEFSKVWNAVRSVGEYVQLKPKVIISLANLVYAKLDKPEHPNVLRLHYPTKSAFVVLSSKLESEHAMNVIKANMED